MDPETARIVLFGIAAVEVTVWLVSLQFVLTTIRHERDRQRQAAEVLQTSELPPNCICGSAEVEGQPADLAAKSAGLLAKGLPPLGPIKILERTEQRVVFENVDLGMNQPGGFLRQGQLRFSPAAAGRTRIDYAIELRRSNVLLGLAMAFQVLGLIALVTGFTLIYAFVVDDPNPGIRAQSIQMVQAIHFLWPPFLFAGLSRVGRKRAMGGIELFISNLPYHSKE
jgi:hypothetical protein